MPKRHARLPNSEREELAALLRKRSVQSGEFTLASGQSATAYVDVKKTVLTGRGAQLAGYMLWQLAQQVAPEAVGVGGLTLGADPLVTAMSIAAWQLDGVDLGAIIVRKDAKTHGTRASLERPALLKAGDEIIAIDDVVTTAGSTLAAVERMRAEGFVVRHAICVVDREDTGQARLAEEGVILYRLFTLLELLNIK